MKILSTLFEMLSDFFIPPTESYKKLRNHISATAPYPLPPAQHLPQNWITSLFSYQDPVVQEIVWQIKYRKDTQVLTWIAEVLSEHLLALSSDKTTYGDRRRHLLLPVPMSAHRRRERGYNHTELIARYIHTTHNKTLSPTIVIPEKVLIHKRHVPPQTSLTRAKRLDNVRGVFSLTPEALDLVRDAHIILLDDVVTTGATLSELRTLLLDAGALSVQALTIAH